MPHRPGHRRTPRERSRPELFDSVLRVLQKHDLINIGYVPDEYVPEVETILPRLPTARGIEDVRRIIHEEYVYWFSAEDAGPQERFDEAAGEIWSIWNMHTGALHVLVVRWSAVQAEAEAFGFPGAEGDQHQFMGVRDVTACTFLSHSLDFLPRFFGGRLFGFCPRRIAHPP